MSTEENENLTSVLTAKGLVMCKMLMRSVLQKTVAVPLLHLTENVSPELQ